VSLTAGNALVYDGTLSLKVISLPALPNVQMLTAFNDANEVLLHNVLMQDETHEHDDHDEVMVELRRQDTKLRLIAELLGMLLMQQQLVPPQIRVRFSGEELAAPASDLPTLAVGSWVRCELYVDPSPVMLQTVSTKAGYTAACRASAAMCRTVSKNWYSASTAAAWRSSGG
jgi:hypothetical protein